MKRRTITFTKPTGKPQRFYATRVQAVLDAVESTLSDAKGNLYIKYSDGYSEWVDDADRLLYLIETWILREQRGTMDAGLVYLVGGKRYALNAATQDFDFDDNMQTVQAANRTK